MDVIRLNKEDKKNVEDKYLFFGQSGLKTIFKWFYIWSMLLL